MLGIGILPGKKTISTINAHLILYYTKLAYYNCTEKRQQHNDGSKTIAEIFKAYVHYEMMAEIYNVWNTNWEVSFRKMRSC